MRERERGGEGGKEGRREGERARQRDRDVIERDRDRKKKDKETNPFMRDSKASIPKKHDLHNTAWNLMKLTREMKANRMKHRRSNTAARNTHSFLIDVSCG